MKALTTSKRYLPTSTSSISNKIPEKDYVVFRVNSDSAFDSLIEKLKDNDPNVYSIDQSKFELEYSHLTRLKYALKDNTEIGYIKFGKINFKKGIEFESKETEAKNREIKLIEEIQNICRRNNKRLYTPSDYIHGLLCSHVYNLTHNIGEKVEVSIVSSESKRTEKLDDWAVGAVYKDEVSKCFAVLYENKKLNQLVLAYRGTVTQGLFDSDNSINTDIKSVFGQNLGKHQAYAYKTLHEVLEIVKNSGYHFSITGHSLGAWLAELSTYFAYIELGYKNIQCVTFDSPGSADMLDLFKSNIQNDDTYFDPKILPIVTYLSFPNLVNICNAHVGKVYKLDTSFETVKSKLKNLPTILQTLSAKLEALKAMDSIMSHSLDCILSEFDPNTGYPSSVVEMQDWPRLHYHNPIRHEFVSDIIQKGLYNLSFPVRMLASPLINIIKGRIPPVMINIVNIFGDYSQNRVNLEQLISLIDNNTVTEGNEIRLNIDREDKEAEFYVTYKSHLKPSNHPYEHRVTKITQEGKIIYQLKKYQKEFNRYSIESYIKEELIDLLKLIKSREGQFYITRDQSDRIMKLYDVAPDLRKALRDITYSHNNVIINDKNAKINKVSYYFDNNYQKRLDQVLQSRNEKNPVIIIGKSGSGKTQLAADSIQKFIEENKGENILVWKFRASNIQDLLLDYKLLAKELKLASDSSIDKSTDIKELKELIEKHLSSEDIKYLFCYDNINDKVYNENNIIYVNSLNNLVLVIAQKLHIKEQDLVVECRGFTEEESVEFLLEEKKKDISYNSSRNKYLIRKEEEHGLELAKELDYLPANLAAARLYMGSRMSISSYRHLLQDEQKRNQILNIQDEKLADNYEFSQISLIINSLSLEVREFLYSLAFYNNESIPAKLFNKDQAGDYHILIDQLISKLNISTSGMDDDISIILHDITKSVLLEKLKREKHDEEILKFALDKLIKYFTKDTRGRENTIRNQQLLPHVNSVLNYLKENENISNASIELLQARLLNIKAYFDTQLGIVNEVTINDSKLAKSIVEKIIELDRDNILAKIIHASILYTLGRMCFYNERLLSKAEGRAYLEKSKKLSEDIGTYKDKSIFYKILSERGGLLYFDKNNTASELREVIKRYKDLLEDENIYTDEEGNIQNLSDDLHHKTICKKQIMNAYMQLAKLEPDLANEHYKEAEIYIKEIEDKLENEFVSNERLADYYNQVANFYIDTGNPLRDLTKAKKLYEKAYSIEKIKNDGKGKLDYPLADSCLGLAKIHRELKDIPEAIKYINDAILIREKLHLLKDIKGNEDNKLIEVRKFKTELELTEPKTSPSTKYTVLPVYGYFTERHSQEAIVMSMQRPGLTENEEL